MQGANNLPEAAQQAIASLQSVQKKVAEVLDVSLRDGAGEEVSVDFTDDGLSMTVRMLMTDAMRALDPATLKVVYVADDGTVEEKQTWVEGDYLCFATEHFSTYVVTGSEPKAPDSGSTDGSSGGSGAVMPGGGNGGGAGHADAAGSSLAPTGDPLTLPLALAGCMVAAALACLACIRAGRRTK